MTWFLYKIQHWARMALVFDKDTRTPSIINTVLLRLPVAKDVCKMNMPQQSNVVFETQFNFFYLMEKSYFIHEIFHFVYFKPLPQHSFILSKSY